MELLKILQNEFLQLEDTINKLTKEANNQYEEKHKQEIRANITKLEKQIEILDNTIYQLQHL